MEQNRRLRRLRGSVFLCIAVLGATSAAAVAATRLAADVPALAALASAVTCASSDACVSGTNTSYGPGVTGTSSTGYGVVGVGKSGFGVRAVSTSNDGLLGTSATGPAGVAGTTAARYGVYGYTTGSSGGTGVYGSSVSGYGTYGTTTSGSGIGVIGYESGSGTGTYGFSSTGYGQEAVTSNGYGLYANAYGTGTGVYVSSGTGYGVIAYTHGNVPIYARNSAGNGGDFAGSYIGLVGRAPASGGYPLVLTDANSNNVFYVDGAGNVSYRGGLYSFAPTRNGATARSFSPKTTLPTIEDTGTAQLVGGVAQVRLDPTFAASIDAGSSYRVFVTPNGDTHGLFVATKTETGFVVRESQAGRATVSFDYRVVATALGQAHQRMEPMIAAAAPAAASPVAPKIQAARPADPKRP